MAGFAFASFSREEWEKLKLVADDRDGLHDTYEDWLDDVLDLRRKLLSEGWTSIEVRMTVEELQAWCKKHRLPLNGQSRSKYAEEKASEMED